MKKSEKMEKSLYARGQGPKSILDTGDLQVLGQHFIKNRLDSLIEITALRHP